MSESYFQPNQKTRTLLYAVRGRVYARRLDEAEAAPLKGVDGLFEPVYSPDNRWLLVDEPAKGLLAKVPPAGGAPVPITTVDMYFRGDWSADGYVYGSDAAGAGAIFRAPDRGGEREWVTQVDLANGERRHRYDRLLPGDSALLSPWSP